MSFVNGARWINGAFTGLLKWAPTGNNTITFPPNASGEVVLNTTIGAATSRVLVYARQDANVLSAGLEVLIPFSTEIIDSQNLFTNGVFTPNSTALYRISIKVWATNPYNTRRKIMIYQGITKISDLYESVDNTDGICGGFVDLQLTTALPYSIKTLIGVGYSTDSVLAGAEIFNTLTIEKLT